MTLFLWLLALGVSLALLTKGAQWMLESAEKIGGALKLSPFIIGVLLVGVGTSLPELVSALYAVYTGATNLVVANAVGSNIANILLVVAIAAVYAGYLKMEGETIDVDFPLLAAGTVLVILMSLDGIISRTESAFLTVGVLLYLVYAVLTKRPEQDVAKRARETISIREWSFFVFGIVALAIGAKYTIDSVIAISDITGIGSGAIALFAVALGTSLPELVTSIHAARQGNASLIFGNIFGSNMFNILAVIGIPGLFATLSIDNETARFGIPVMIAATVLFFVSGLSRRINRWEGIFLLFVYVYFIGNIFGLL